MADEWTAYCAPGREAITRAFVGAEVTEVSASPVMTGTDVILVNRTRMDETWEPEPFRVSEPCRLCGWLTMHSITCYLNPRWWQPAPSSNSFPILTGA